MTCDSVITCLPTVAAIRSITSPCARATKAAATAQLWILRSMRPTQTPVSDIHYLRNLIAVEQSDTSEDSGARARYNLKPLTMRLILLLAATSTVLVPAA